jgi:hypothetical protein
MIASVQKNKSSDSEDGAKALKIEQEKPKKMNPQDLRRIIREKNKAQQQAEASIQASNSRQNDNLKLSNPFENPCDSEEERIKDSFGNWEKTKKLSPREIRKAARALYQTFKEQEYKRLEMEARASAPPVPKRTKSLPMPKMPPPVLPSSDPPPIPKRPVPKLSQKIQPSVPKRTPPPIPPRKGFPIRYSIEQLWNLLRAEKFVRPTLPNRDAINNIKDAFFYDKDTIGILQANIDDSGELFRMKFIDFRAPDAFTFQLEYDDYPAMMEAMDQVYTDYQHHLDQGLRHVIVEYLQVGQIVVVEHDGGYHRAEVKNPNSGYYGHEHRQTATVVLIDNLEFDVEMQIFRDLIYHLHRQFARIPRKSARGKMWGVEPAILSYTDDEINAMKKILPSECLASSQFFTNGAYLLNLFDIETGKSIREMLAENSLVKDFLAPPPQKKEPVYDEFDYGW